MSSTKSHSSKLSTGDRLNRSPSVSTSAQKLKTNNSDVVEDKKELIKTRDLVDQIRSPSGLSDPDPSFNHTNSQKVEGGRVEKRRRRRRSASCLRIETGEVGGSNFHGNHCLMEIKNRNDEEKIRGGKSKMMLKMRLKEVSSCLQTSKEIVRVLNHVWATEDDDQTTLSLITALKSELDRAKNRVDHLIIENESAFHGEENADHEKVTLMYKERARVRSTIISMADEVEVEKKLRRRAQRLNNTIAKELAHTKLSLSKAIKDLQRERRAKEIFEQICDELAKGIGEDRAEFEELKKESEKVREEVEKEREMLQLADILREERVQMKLSEAKFEFEQKNAAVESLKHDLEAAFFITQQQQQQQKQQDHSRNKFDQIRELQAYLKKINFGSCQTKHEQQQQQHNNDCCSDEEEESDLHSIELNMDNTSKSYRWSFVHSSKRNSFEKDQIDARKSNSDKIQWESICFNRKPRKSHENSERFMEVLPNEIKNTKSGKCLRDILFPESVEDLNEVVAKTEDGIALSLHMEESST